MSRLAAVSESIEKIFVVPSVLGRVADRLEFLDDLGPRCTRDVLEDHDRRLVLGDVVDHAPESRARLSLRVDALGLVVEGGKVDTGGPCDEDVDVAGDLGEASVGGVRLVVPAEITQSEVSEEMSDTHSSSTSRNRSGGLKLRSM